MISFFRRIFKKKPSKKKEPKTLTFPEIGWKITLPKQFNLLDENHAAAYLKNHPAHAPGVTGEHQPKTLFIAQFGHANFFNCFMGLLPALEADEAVGREKDSSKKKLTDLYHSKYHKQSKVTIQTIADSMMIGELEFESYDIVVNQAEHIILQISNYYHVHKGYYINISATFTEDEAGKEMFHALLKSKFDDVPKKGKQEGQQPE